MAGALTGGVLGLLCSLVWAATPLDEGLRLLERGEGLRALAVLKPLAHDGSAEAQYRLGTIYERGLGILPDDYWAWYWYQVAAAQGHTPAVDALQALAARHHGVLPGAADTSPDVAAAEPPALGGADPFVDEPAAAPAAPSPAVPEPLPATDAPVQAAVTPAAAGLQSAASSGRALSPGPGELAALGRARAAGIVVDFDPARPLPASRGDDVTGQPTGEGLAEGAATVPGPGPSPAAASGAPPPTVVAAGPPGGTTGAATAASPAVAPATMALARLPAEAADALASLPDPDLTALASGGNVAAQRELALRLHSGRGRAPDLPAAIAWYRRAAEAGDAEAQYRLGNLYLMGDGIEADDAWAITWFRRAAAQGHAKAEAHLEKLVRLFGNDS